MPAVTATVETLAAPVEAGIDMVALLVEAALDAVAMVGRLDSTCGQRREQEGSDRQ